MTPGVVTSAVPPDLADASGAVSLLTVKHAFFSFTPLLGGIFARSSCTPSATCSGVALRLPLIVEKDPIDDFDWAEFNWEYDGFESVKQEAHIALSPPPPVFADIWPQVRCHIDEHHTREIVDGAFPSAVFSRSDHLRLWLKGSFVGLNEVTFQLALDHVKTLLERHFKELHSNTPPTESLGSGGRSSALGGPSRKPKGRRCALH